MSKHHDPSEPQRSIDYLNNPDQWHRFSVQSVKHINEAQPDAPNFPLLGVVRAGEPTVYLTNIFYVSRGMDWTALPQRRFDSMEALVLAGWRVD